MPSTLRTAAARNTATSTQTLNIRIARLQNELCASQAQQVQEREWFRLRYEHDAFVNAGLTRIITELECEKANHKYMIQGLQRMASESTSDAVNHLKAQKAELEKVLEETFQENDRLRAGAPVASIGDAAQNEIGELKKQLLESNKRITKLENDAHGDKQALGNCCGEIVKLNQALDTANDRTDQLVAQVNEQAVMDERNKIMISDLKKELQKSKKTIKNANTSIREYQQALGVASNQWCAINAALRAIEASFELLECKLNLQKQMIAAFFHCQKENNFITQILDNEMESRDRKIKELERIIAIKDELYSDLIPWHSGSATTPPQSPAQDEAKSVSTMVFSYDPRDKKLYADLERSLKGSDYQPEDNDEEDPRDDKWYEDKQVNDELPSRIDNWLLTTAD